MVDLAWKACILGTLLITSTSVRDSTCDKMHVQQLTQLPLSIYFSLMDSTNICYCRTFTL